MMIPVQTDHALAYWTVPLVLGWLQFIPMAIQGISALAGALGKGAKGSQDARMQQDQANAGIYGHATQGAAAQGQYDLSRHALEQKQQATRMNDAMRASGLQNVADFSMGGPGAFKAAGGLRPSTLQGDPKMMEALQAYQAQQLQKLSQGEGYANIKWPEVPQASKAGLLEKIMGGAGLAGSLLGGLGNAGLLGGTNPMSAAPSLTKGWSGLEGIVNPASSKYDIF